MAVEPGEKPQGEEEGEVLELTPELDAPEVEEGKEPEAKPEGEDDEEVIVSIGEEAAPALEGEAPEWVRELRKRNRELERKVAEFEKGGNSVPELGPEPTLESCDYDEIRFQQEHRNWLRQEAAAEQAKSEARKAEEAAQSRWQGKLGTYAQQKDTLPVQDFDKAEEEVLSALTPQQQAILIQGAENKALLVYALGKSPEKLRQLAATTDPIEFAFAAARLEGQTSMQRRPRTQPEGKVTGSAPLSGSTDKTEQRLEAEAEKTGDRTKLIAYRKQKRQAA